MNSKFKSGDYVRCVDAVGQGTSQCLILGETYKILKINEPPSNYVVLVGTNDNNGLGWMPSRFSFVAEGRPEKSELQMLIEKANEGFDAVDRLNRHYPEKYQFKGERDKEFRTSFCPAKIYQFREIPKKPKFEGYQTKDSEHSVSIGKLGTLQVGCQEFDVQEVFEALKSLCEKQIPRMLLYKKGQDVTATRKGILVSGGIGEITWAEADELLQKLKEAGYNE